MRSASPKAVHLRASRSTFSHHAVIHHDASPAAIAAAGAMLSEAPALRCHDDSPAPLSMPMATYASTASTPASAALAQARRLRGVIRRSEEHTSELQSLMRISYAVFCLKQQNSN